MPTLTASQGLKNWYFTMNFLSQHHLYFNNTCTKCQGQKFHQKKDIQNLPTCVAMKKISLLPTLIASRGLNFFLFAMKFLEHQVLYVNNICSKFQGQKINKEKDTHNLPTCVIWRKFSLLPTLTPSQGLKNCFFTMNFFS